MHFKTQNMNSTFKIYNTLKREKVEFKPINPPFVGMYVCGPTVYGEPHMGHARTALTFDILYRYLLHLDYKVRYVRNITDVGHLENDADEGEDKIAKKARLEKLEPMEVAQFYTNAYQEAMKSLNLMNPSIEPRASGHISEQIEIIEKIIENGYAYEANGSVYFDVKNYATKFAYGSLSGRTNLDELEEATRDNLKNQQEKRNAQDFALWKKASPEHIMRWKSPWSVGFPGWHIECTAMSTKYLGELFDIHGGGMDLVFPHHEAEIAQTNACQNHVHEPLNQANYWMHCNMLTINGKKMGKSLGNFITLNEFFSGNHPLLEQAYSPMTIRLFFLQAHYRSTVDFSNEALQASEKAFKKIMNAVNLLGKVAPGGKDTFDVQVIENDIHDAMNDDLNTAVLIAHLFDMISKIHGLFLKSESLTEASLDRLKFLVHVVVFDILGLKEETQFAQQLDEVMKILIELRNNARKDKNFALSDEIRNKLSGIGIALKDSSEGTFWSLDA